MTSLESATAWFAIALIFGQYATINAAPPPTKSNSTLTPEMSTLRHMLLRGAPATGLPVESCITTCPRKMTNSVQTNPCGRSKALSPTVAAGH